MTHCSRGLPVSLLSRCLLFVLLACAAGRASAQGLVSLGGHRTEAAATASVVGRVAATAPVTLTLALAPRDPHGMGALLRRLYDPGDSLYGRFLTPAQFTARFSPTQSQYDAVAAFALKNGLTITGTSANRLLLEVEAPSAAVEAAFGVHLQRLLSAHGRLFHAPDRNPRVPAPIAALLTGVVGLDNSAVWDPHSQPMTALPDLDPLEAPMQIGTGPGGGLSPSDIRTAYGLAGLPATVNGTGQALGLFELDGYQPADITAYENQFAAQLGVAQFPLVTAIPVDGGSGALGAGQAEVTLDIELQIALAPGVNQIFVYEGPNTGSGVIATYNQIALDDRAKQISTSWGLAESESGAAFVEAEAPVFAELAAQGQTIYAASGDNGAHDDTATPGVLAVDDPASQPYVTGTGGTSLALGAGGVHGTETAWGSSGGGVSAFWPIPYWQLPVVAPPSTSIASTTMRNVPDVSLDADPYTGYAISLNGGWTLYGGTSCAAPLWAAFTALVNQQRATAGEGPLGFANPLLYAIGSGRYGSYAADFYDVASGSNGSGGYFDAVPGYDDVTGLGTFNGANLLADLTVGPSVGPTLTGSADASGVALSWTPVAGAVNYSVYRALTSGAEGSTPLGAGLTTTTYTDAATAPGTAYYYVVTAVSAAGVAVPSNEVSVTTPTTLAVQGIGASPATVTGTTTTLSAQATAPPGQALTYAWSVTGPGSVSYSVNGTTTANVTTATFSKPGSYQFTVTVTDAAGHSVQSSVAVAVAQTLTALTVTPPAATLAPGQTQQFNAAGTDQFGAPLPAAPAWAVDGGGAVTPAGLFTAGTAPGGPYALTATQAGVTAAAQVTVAAPTPPVDDAAFVSQSVPAAMAAGQDYPATLTFRNTGTTTWTDAAAYHLGSQDPQDNTTWLAGTNRAHLPPGDAVAPGQDVTFSLTVTAPAAPGTYPFQWRLVRDGVRWFGDDSPALGVTVAAPAGAPPPTVDDAAFVSQSVPAAMAAGQDYPATLTFRNTGTTTWTDAAAYHLGSQDPQDNTTWLAGTNRAHLPPGDAVAPGQDVTFSLTVTAPAAPGTYPFQWRLVRDGVHWFGDDSPALGVAVAAPAGAPSPVAQVNAGGGAAAPFAADQGYSGGSTYATGAAIDTSGVTGAAPPSVYQSERFGDFTYTVPGLTPGGPYTLRLHFAEIYWGAAGQRLFNVSVNGSPFLTDFDVFAAAGGKDRAVVESVPVTADASGRVTVVFTTLKDNAKVSGIELLTP